MFGWWEMIKHVVSEFSRLKLKDLWLAQHYYQTSPWQRDQLIHWRQLVGCCQVRAADLQIVWSAGEFSLTCLLTYLQYRSSAVSKQAEIHYWDRLVMWSEKQQNMLVLGFQHFLIGRHYFWKYPWYSPGVATVADIHADKWCHCS